MERIEAKFVVLALLLHAVFWLAWGGRTWVLSHNLDIDLGPRRAVSIVLSSLFAASITPSYAGGEPVRLYLLAREGEIGAGRAGSVVFTERFLDLLLFGIFFLGSSLYMYRHFDLQFVKWLFLGAAAILGFAMTVFVASLRSIEVVERVLKATFLPLSIFVPDFAEGLENRLEESLAEFNSSLSVFVGEKRGAFVLACLLTLIQWLPEFLIPYLLFQGLGVDITVLEGVVGISLITVLIMVPFTPGGSGVAEASAVGMYGLFDDATGVVFFPFPWRLITYYTNLVVGFVVSAYLLNDMDLVRERIESISK